MLYSVQIRDKKAFIYLLFEHKSYEDNWVGFQLLRNMVKIWEHYLKQNKNAEFLLGILPVVIYHGELVWNMEKAIGHLFEDNENMRDYIPEFKIEMMIYRKYRRKT